MIILKFVKYQFITKTVFNFYLVIDIIVLKAPKPVIGGIIEEEKPNIIGEMEWFKNVDPFILIFDLVENIFSTSKEFLLEDTSALQYQINSTENLEKSRKNFSAKIVVSFNSIFTLKLEFICRFLTREENKKTELIFDVYSILDTTKILHLM